MKIQGSSGKRFIKRGLMVAVAGVSVQMAARQAAALTSFTYTGTTYTQLFSSLPANTSGTDVTPVPAPSINGTIYTLPNSPAAYDLSTEFGTNSSLTGWYASDALKNVYGANGGSTTTGGIYAFGASSTSPALGIISTTTSGLGEVGVLLYNNTSTTYNQIDLSYNAELWHQNTTAKSLNFAYAVQSSPTALPTSGLTAVSALNSGSFATGVATGDLTAPVATNAISDPTQSISNWAPGTYLWLTWTMNIDSGSGQGIGVGNLSFSAAAIAFPPATVTWNVTNGNWNATEGNWTGGSPNPNQYKDGDNAVFGTISADSLVTVDSGGVLPGSVVISNNSNTYTFQGGAIGGTGSVTMSGTGTAIFKSTNTYAGGTFLNSGTLAIDGGDDRLGAAGQSVTFAGGTLQTNTVGLTSSRNNIINTGGGTFNTNGLSSVLSGTVTIGDAFNVVGGGNLTISGNMATAAAGLINVGVPTATSLDPTTLTLTQTSGTDDFGVSGGTINGNIVIAGTARINFSQGVFGTTVTSGPKPEIQIQTSNGYSNATDTSATELTSGPNITNASGDVGGTIGINIHLNSLVSDPGQFTRSDVTVKPFPVGNGFAFPASNAFIATIGGTKGPKDGNGNTTHTGNLIINGVIYGLADLNISNDPINGGGSGDVTLNAQNQYTGVTMDNSNNSTLYLGVNNALPVGTDLVFGTLGGFGAPVVDLDGHNQTVNSLSWGGVGAANAVKITNTGTANSVLTVGSPSSTTTPGADFGGLLADGIDRVDGSTPRTLALVKDGSGTLVLSGVFTSAVANTYSGGTTVKGGVLQIPNDAALGASGGALTLDGGAISYADSADFVTSITTSSDRQLNVTGNGGTINTVCVDGTGTTNTANVTFTGVGGYNWGSTAGNPLNIVGASGSVTINGGAGSVVVTPGATIAIATGATLNAGGTADPFTDSLNPTQHVAVVNNGNINVASGTEAISSLSGTGATTLNAGATLLVTDNIASSNGSGTLALNGGTLGGHGTVYAVVSGAGTVAPSATLAPTSTGTLTVGGLTTNGDTTLQFNLVTPGNALNSTISNSDTIAVTGSGGLVLNGGTVDLTNHSTGAASLGFYKVMSINGGIGGTGLSSLTLPATANNVAYTFDTTHDPGFVDIHRGFLGDVDDSGFVDINDLATLAAHWQQAGGWAQGNFLGDAVVDINDLSVLAAHWQTGIASFDEAADSLSGTSESFQQAVASIVFDGASSVPEPTSLALLGMGAAGLLIRRRNRR